MRKLMRPAIGIVGIVHCVGADSFFRIYDKKYPDGFKDYDIRHHDFKVQILDDDAFLDDENECLDYSDETLGRC